MPRKEAHNLTSRRQFMIAGATAGASALVLPGLPLAALVDSSSNAAAELRRQLNVIIVQLASTASPRHWLEERLRQTTAAHAAAPPAYGRCTIWEVVLRMAYWLHEARRCVLQGPPAPPRHGPWPSVVDTSETAWQAAIDELMAAHEALIEAVRRFPAQRLHDLVDAISTLSNGHSTKYVDVLRTVYHCNIFNFFGINALIQGRRQSDLFLAINARPVGVIG